MFFLVLALAAGIIFLVDADCWIPARHINDLCEVAARNNTPAQRRLLWVSGGPDYVVQAAEYQGTHERYRGDGGTIPYTGPNSGQPGTVDFNLIKQKKIEDIFYDFVEGRALRGKNKIYNYENGWYQDLLACSSRADMQMCETCGRHCNSWEWETSGYAVLNGSELDMATLIWLTAGVYVSESVLLSASVCVQYDWWLCLRRLDENVQTFVLA